MSFTNRLSPWAVLLPLTAVTGEEIEREEFERRLAEQERQLRELRALYDERFGPERAAPEDLETLRRELESELGSEPEPPEEPSSTTRSLNLLNPRITAFGDFLGRLDDGRVLNEDGDEIGDRFGLREVELDFRAAVDPYAKGVIILALEEEAPNDYDATVEEGYLTFETLPWNLRLKAGRFRSHFGSLNRLHTHDLPQSSRPLAVVNFLGEEGDVENGLGLSYLVHGLPGLTLEAQVLNGENDAILAGESSKDPAWLGRAAWFQDLGPTVYTQLGLSHLYGFTDSAGKHPVQLSGVDLIYKWQPEERSESRSLVVHGEAFLLDRELPDDRIQSFGGFAMLLYQLAPRWYAGMRYDFSELADQDRDAAWSLGPHLSFYTTEFLRIRVGYEHREVEGGPDLDSLFGQITFIIGSHPVEPYWFNK